MEPEVRAAMRTLDEAYRARVEETARAILIAWWSRPGVVSSSSDVVDAVKAGEDFVRAVDETMAKREAARG